MTLRLSPIASAALAALASLSSLPALAQADYTASTHLDQVVVTASRAPMQLSDVVADVTVLTRADIERLGYGDINDLLRSSGAVEMVRTGGIGQTTSLFIRGADTNQTMVLIDGVRVDSQSASGGAPWETIPMSQIERIEIVKGAASAIYGSDAIGGVIQIFTRKGDGPLKADIGISGGSLGTTHADANLRGSSGIFDYALSAATEHSKGFQLVPDTSNYNYNPERAGYQKHEATARLGVQLDAQDRLELIALNSHLDADFNAYSATALGQLEEETSTQKLAWNRQWSSALQTQLSYGESEANYNDITDVYSTKSRSRNYALDGSLRLDAQQQLLFVLERREDHLDSSDVSNPSVSDRSDDGAALGYIGKFGALELQAHGRHDRNSEFGNANTGSLGLGYELAPGLRIVGSAANAFRAPTIYQNSSIYGPLSLPGGQSLKPESAHNLEIGLKYLGMTTDWSVTAYRNEIRNLINFGAATDCLSNSYGCYSNVANAQLQGLSLAGHAAAGAGVQLSGTLDFQAPKDTSTGKLLARRATQFGTLRAETTLQGWDLGSGLLFSGRRYDDAGNTTRLGGYALLGLDAACHLTRELKLQLNLDNAFNRTYQTANGYAQPPRTVMVGLRYTPSL